MVAGQASNEEKPDIRAELESLRKDKDALRDELVKLQGQKEQLEAQRAAMVQPQAAQAIRTARPHAMFQQVFHNCHSGISFVIRSPNAASEGVAAPAPVHTLATSTGVFSIDCIRRNHVVEVLFNFPIAFVNKFYSPLTPGRRLFVLLAASVWLEHKHPVKICPPGVGQQPRI